MKIFAVIIVVCVASLSMAATIAYAKMTPISGTSVGLEHDPAGIIARGTTDGQGNVTFDKLKPGHYAVVLLDTSKLTAPVRVIVGTGPSAGPQISEPILPGKSGAPAYVLDMSGRRLTVEIAHADGKISVSVENAW
jgi:hypothetical protein